MPAAPAARRWVSKCACKTGSCTCARPTWPAATTASPLRRRSPRVGFAPATWPASTPRATTRSSAARADRIISGGENIDPGEIEQIASADPAVAEAAVVGVADAQWGEVPVLVLVLRPAAVADWSALRAAFDAKLARFKHPRRIVVLDALPKTALGKVRKTELAQRLV